jgi:putative transposase
MVEEILAARGICVTYETVRQWGKKFGKAFAAQIGQRAPARGDKWHLDGVLVSIAGEKHWLWRAVDQNGFVLDVLVQCRRDGSAVQGLMAKLLKSAATPPRVMITDMSGRPRWCKKNLFEEHGAWSGADMCPASAAACHMPPARMGVRGAGPIQARALKARIRDLVFPIPSR